MKLGIGFKQRDQGPVLSGESVEEEDAETERENWPTIELRSWIALDTLQKRQKREKFHLKREGIENEYRK